jgi:hypothetical protein
MERGKKRIKITKIQFISKQEKLMHGGGELYKHRLVSDTCK